MKIKDTVKKLGVIALFLTTLANCVHTGQITKNQSEILGKDGTTKVAEIIKKDYRSHDKIDDMIYIIMNKIAEAREHLNRLDIIKDNLTTIEIKKHKQEVIQILDDAQYVLLDLQKILGPGAVSPLMGDIESVRRTVALYY